MVHFTCDLCGRELEDDDRFIVKIEVFAAREPAGITEADLDEDNLEAVAQLLAEANEDPDLDEPEPSSRHYRYDLCPACRKRYELRPARRPRGGAEIRLQRKLRAGT